MIDFGKHTHIEKRTEIVINALGSIDVIVEYVANGGSLLSWCENNTIRFSDIHDWIYRNPERKVRYEGAVKARTEWLVQSVLREFEAVGLCDIREAYDENSVLKDVKSMPRAVAAAITSIETFEEHDKMGNYLGRTRKVRFNDKINALKELGKNIVLLIPPPIIVKGEITHKIDKLDLEDRIRKTLTVMEAEHINADD